MALTQEQKNRAKLYRDKIKTAAIAGGHVFKAKGQGNGQTVKKVSKNGKEYYYQPWNTLTAAQKKERISKSLDYARNTREMARKYKVEHGIPIKGKK